MDVQSASSALQLAEELRAAIMRGDLEPGEPLREAALATAAEVSRETVRGAIKALVNAGLVEHRRHRGAAVIRPTHADVIDVFRTRHVLELSAVAAWSTATRTRRAAVTDAIEALCAPAAKGDWLELSDRDLGFHAALVGLHNGTRIDAFYRTVRSTLALHIALLYRGNQSWEDPLYIADEHREIYEALVAGGCDHARELLDRHLQRNRERLLELLD